MNQQPPTNQSIFHRIGPGLITACVVIGPGSILTSSRVGAEFGFGLIWVLVVAAVLMMIYMTLGAKLGAVAKDSPGQIISQRVGPWLTALIGISIFAISSSYQFGNNLGVASALSTFLKTDSPQLHSWILVGFLLVFNAMAIVFMFTMKELYKWLERLMSFFVMAMLLAFLATLGFAVAGRGSDFPTQSEVIASKPFDHIVTVIGWIGTTFITAVAYYQAYLVRQKGWGEQQLQSGLVDARVGTVLLSLITLVIMSTAAIVLRGRDLGSVGDVAQQFRPLFGIAGQIVFCIGLFCAAYSSFLVNSMIGGFMLAEGLGLGADPKTFWPRAFTVCVLVIGVVIASPVLLFNYAPVPAIVFAQAVTVVAAPLIGFVLWWLTSIRDVMGEHRNGIAAHIGAGAGILMLLILSAYLILVKIVPMFLPTP